MDINIRVEPEQIIEIKGKKYETTGEFRKPGDGEHWLCESGCKIYNKIHFYIGHGPRLILRPLPTRKVPTDQDAAVWPRRKCWCDNVDITKDSATGVLLAVDPRPGVEFQYHVLMDNGSLVYTKFCEIEVQE